MNSFKRFFRKVYNVYRWLPTIWKDQDWDDSFIVDILVKKLEHQRDFFLSGRAIAACSDEIAAEIQKAIDGLRKTTESWEYEEHAVKELDKKWGEGKFRVEPLPENPNLSELHIDYPNVKTPEDQAQHNKEYKEAMSAARKQYIKDKRMVYKYIADNIDKWWD